MLQTLINRVRINNPVKTAVQPAYYQDGRDLCLDFLGGFAVSILQWVATTFGVPVLLQFFMEVNLILVFWLLVRAKIFSVLFPVSF